MYLTKYLHIITSIFNNDIYLFSNISGKMYVVGCA